MPLKATDKGDMLLIELIGRAGKGTLMVKDKVLVTRKDKDEAATAITALGIKHGLSAKDSGTT